MNFFKTVWQVIWYFLYTIYRPVAWVVVASYKAYKGRNKSKFKTSDVVTKVQGSAATELPELTKRRDELMASMKKLTDKFNVDASELATVNALIAAAGGDIGQRKSSSNRNSNSSKNSKNNNQQQNQQSSKNSNQSSVPKIGDADFA